MNKFVYLTLLAFFDIITVVFVLSSPQRSAYFIGGGMLLLSCGVALALLVAKPKNEQYYRDLPEVK